MRKDASRLDKPSRSRSEVKAGRMLEFLAGLYGEAVLLVGPPGVGKSETVRRVARKLAEERNLRFVEWDYGVEESGDAFYFVDLRLTEVEPSDLVGIPVISGDCVDYKPLRWAYVLSKHPGLLFLDELTNVQRDDVLTAAYKILLDRRVGWVRLHPDVWVVAAGNRPEHSSVARPLPAPLVNRVIIVDFPAPSLNEWKEYMDANYEVWDRRVFAYLKMFPNDFMSVPEGDRLSNFPTPRSWTKLAVNLPKLAKDSEDVNALCKGCLGEEVGEKFATFLNNSFVDLADLLRSPDKFSSLTLEQRHFLCVLLASWLEVDVNERFRKALPLLKEIFSHSRELIMFLTSIMKGDAAGKLLRLLSEEVKGEMARFMEGVVGYLECASSLA